ncbi:MAG: restriction endonuclease subunit S [Lachnospiraceae bacterium]|nr:restriction endonuclease subunit S [Lachnospiraceae bacterium]
MVFLKSWGEIDERLDPAFYLNIILLDKNIVSKSAHPVSTFKQKVRMQRGRFGHRPRNDPRYYNGIYPFIQTGNIVKASETDEKIEFTQTLNELGLSTSRLFDEKVVVITIAANIGYTAILDYPACFPDSLVALTSKDDKLSLEYLNIYIRFIRKYIENLAPQAAQKNINLKQLGKLPIIIPDKDIQHEIISIMKKAYSKKMKKENHAQELLNSINDYLLQELGMVMPSDEENLLENRTFYVSSTKVLGNRFDPVVYSKKSEFYKNPASIFKWVKFRDIIISVQTGLPVRQDFRAENGMYPYYGANGIIGYMDEYTHDGQYLVIGQDGYIGNHYIVNGKFWASNHNWVIKLNTNLCNYDYVKAFLDFWNYSHLVTGGVIPKLTQSSVNKIPIVLPELKVQDNIALEIKQICAKARILEQEAQNDVDIAKRQLKKIFFGGNL